MTLRRILTPIIALLPFLVLGHGQAPKADLDSTGVPPKSPAESLKAFEVAPGFRIELVAAEPLVQSPVACDWDEDGRLYVVELPEYNAYAATKPHGRGRVVCLEDTDGDGVMDKRTVFADNLDYPTGVICCGGGVYVGCCPGLALPQGHRRRRQGRRPKRRADWIRHGQGRRGATQFVPLDAEQPHPHLDRPRWRGVEEPDGKTVSLRNMNVLFDPRDDAWETTSGGGQHGMAVDDFGRVFVSGNSDPIQYLAYDARYLARSAERPGSGRRP